MDIIKRKPYRTETTSFEIRVSNTYGEFRDESEMLNLRCTTSNIGFKKIAELKKELAKLVKEKETEILGWKCCGNEEGNRKRHLEMETLIEETQFLIKVWNTYADFKNERETLVLECKTRNIELQKVAEIKKQLIKLIEEKKKEMLGCE